MKDQENKIYGSYILFMNLKLINVLVYKYYFRKGYIYIYIYIKIKIKILQKKPLTLIVKNVQTAL